jgi:N-acetylglucosaminyl-diphospho-decaprenol L-rhamnosyltransferase
MESSPEAREAGPEHVEDRVAVVVITRNRSAVLEASLGRLIGLAERPRVLVVDNASCDDTVGMVRRSYPSVVLLALERNLGAAARNVGVRHADTRYVAFSDDDSWWGEGALGRAADLLDAHPRLALVAARILVGHEEHLDRTCALMAKSPLLRAPGLPGVPVLGFLACGAIVRRSAFEAVGGFQERRGVGGEEQFLAVDLAQAGHQLAYVSEVTAHHHPARRGGCSPARRAALLRNDLLFAWLRRSPPSALSHTAWLVARALGDAQARTVLAGSLMRAPWLLSARRPVSPALERELRRLAR